MTSRISYRLVVPYLLHYLCSMLFFSVQFQLLRDSFLKNTIQSSLICSSNSQRGIHLQNYVSTLNQPSQHSNTPRHGLVLLCEDLFLLHVQPMLHMNSHPRKLHAVVEMLHWLRRGARVVEMSRQVQRNSKKGSRKKLVQRYASSLSIPTNFMRSVTIHQQSAYLEPLMDTVPKQ